MTPSSTSSTSPPDSRDPSPTGADTAADEPIRATPPASQREFHRDVHTTFQTVRRRLGTIVEGVCGGSPRAQDVTNRFGVYRKLGWQIWNVVYAPDALAATRYLPSPKPMKVWREAARQRGTPEEDLARLDEALKAFHKSVDAHAVDREMLEVLVEGVDGRRDAAAEVKWRKQAFNGNAYTWGVRARRLMSVGMVAPAAKPGYFDLLRLQGLLGLVRTRPGVRWPFAQLFIRDPQGRPTTFPRHPLDNSKAVKETGVPLLVDFCSQPLPEVERLTTERGVVEDELLPGPVGQRGATDIVTGEILRDVAPINMEPGATNSFGTGVRTPGELFVSDLFIHRDLMQGAKRELAVFGELITPLSRDERDRIPVADQLQSLGRASESLATADLPRHRDLIRYAVDKVGWHLDDFNLYRVRMPYPPIPVSVVVLLTNAGSR